ncbi:MAG: AAA family ATPase [Elioraea sp.]|nr:AAA family ATPase [Elioraea sp.]
MDASPALDHAAEQAEGPSYALSRPLLVAYVTDAESEGTLRAAMAELGPDLTIHRGGISYANRDLARKPTPQVLIVDVSGVANPILALDELANVCEPDVKVLVIGEQTDLGFYREITRGLGVVEYLEKPLTRDAVVRLFLPVVQGRTAFPHEITGGRVVAVVGAHGGVGTTTVAVNLAVLLAEHTRGYVALVDLNLQTGAAATMLGVKPSAGLRVALEQPDRVDALFLDRTAVPVSDRLRLIAAEEPFEEAPRPTATGVARLMALLRRRFNWIVVDMPTAADAALLAVYSVAQTRILVLTPDIVAVRDTARLRTMLTALAGNDRALTVLNRSGVRGGLPVKMVEKGLGTQIDFRLPEVDKEVLAALNLGVPACARSKPLRQAMLALTREVSGARVAMQGGLLRRLFTR